MKALLVFKGYNLYSQIWSDQPPFFTHLLAAQFQIFGLKVHASRLFMLLLSSLMIGAVFLYLSFAWSTPVALLGTAFWYFCRPSRCSASRCWWASHRWYLPSLPYCSSQYGTFTQTGLAGALRCCAGGLRAYQVIYRFHGAAFSSWESWQLPRKSGCMPFRWKKAIQPGLVWSLAFGTACLMILGSRPAPPLSSSSSNRILLPQPHRRSHPMSQFTPSIII